MAIHHCSLPTCSATTIAVITEEHRTVDSKNLIDTKPHDDYAITFRPPFNVFVLFVCLLLFATSEVVCLINLYLEAPLKSWNLTL